MLTKNLGVWRESGRQIRRARPRVLRENADRQHSHIALLRLGLACAEQALADSGPANGFDNEQLGNEPDAALLLNDVDGIVVDEKHGPTDCNTILLGSEDAALVLSHARHQNRKIILAHLWIDPAVRFHFMFEFLQAIDERDGGRFVLRPAGIANSVPLRG